MPSPRSDCRYALPEIFTGLKVGAAISATAAVVAEFVASDRGLGYLLLQYNGDLNTQMVFATVMVLGAIGLAVYFAGGIAGTSRRFPGTHRRLTGEVNWASPEQATKHWGNARMTQNACDCSLVDRCWPRRPEPRTLSRSG